MEVTLVDAFMPDYSRHCTVCGAVPVVTAVKGDELVYEGQLCGPCTWGEAAMADPDEWNK